MIHMTFDPIFFRLGGLEVGWHGLLTAVAVVFGVWFGSRRATRYGIASAQLGNVAVWVIGSGIVGARLFHVLDHLSYFSDHPLEAFAVWEGGIAVYGSFIGGTLGGIFAARRYRIPVWALLDAVAPVVLVGQMIGRLGCFANGDAWGEPTGGEWGLVYEHSNTLLPSALLGVPTHAYPVYEIAAVSLLLGLMWTGRRFLQLPGETFLVAAIGYAIVRAGLTFFRQEPVILWGMQEAQVIGVVTGALAAGLLVLNRRRQKMAGRALAH